MSSKSKQPEYLNFLCPLTVEAAGEADKQMPRFRMVAYTGGVMRITGFPHPVVVDLEGLAIDRQDIPVRLDHNPRQGVGHTQRVVIDNGQVVAEGLVSRDTSWARDVAKSGVNGFPWQASIGAAVVDADFIPNGQSITVNGRTFDGPLHVVRKAILKEISFVDSGADPSTTARIAAQSKEQTSMDANDTSTANQDTAAQPASADTIVEAAANDTPPAQETPPAPPPATPATVNASAADGDPVTAMRQRMAAETRRVEAIHKLCAGKHPDVEAQAIEDGWDETRTELHILRASRPKVPAVATSQRPAGPHVFEAVALMASGMPMGRIEAVYAAPILEAADRLRGVGIQEFCELACGRQLPRFRRDASGWLQAAFSTTSLPGILSNIANKMLLEGYNYIEDAWRKIAKIASVNDFKEHSRYRMTGAFKFEQVGPDGELKHGKLDEQKYGQKADTHGIMFALTRQMIINDDMGAFTDIPRQIGMGAAESIADAVWGLWLSNPVQTDGKAFFSTDHKNYAEGADTALTVDGLTAAEVLFGEQTKPNGRPLGVPATILLVPTALKVPAEMLMKSVQLNETTTANKAKPSTNPHVGKFDVVSSVFLSNASFTGYSSKAWYLLADPNRLPAIEIAFLNGVDRPTVEKTDADFNTLGIQFRGYIDFGVREQDFRGAAKMKGEV
ncbi:MAG TPA: Mu-like prophage major head subunit gpT family protein [Phycisphaerae bacterium]|nr:Mu-like prophage major head subunit gpT family protein [Phycisphaerae bacterium]